MVHQSGDRSRPLRVAYVSGPAEGPRIYTDLVENRAPSYFGTNYMQGFLQMMIEMGAEVWIETWHDGAAYRIRKDSFTFNNSPLAERSGVRYHLSMIWAQLRLLVRLARFRPSLVVLTGHGSYWWVYAPLRLLGTRFMATLHGAIWTPYQPLKLHQRIFRRLNAALAYPSLEAAVVTSHLIGQQLAHELGPKADRIAIYHHLPSYGREWFEGILPVERLPGTPFRVFFSGRIIADKGIFDLVELAAQLEAMRPGEFRFEVCGDGPDFAEFRSRIVERSLQEVVTCHGYCKPDRMRETIGQCHAVIVPTRTECAAGFEMTCAEAILSGRPLVTSAVAPALEYLREASIEVEPNNVMQYRDAILLLKDDAELYRRLQSECARLGMPFFAYERSWDYAMRQAFGRITGRTFGELASERTA